MTHGRRGLQGFAQLAVALGCVALGLSAATWTARAEAQWRPERWLVLVGTAVTMNTQDEVIPDARIFMRDGKIQAVGRPGEALPAAADDALVVGADGFIYPGLIDRHNHPEWNVFPLWVVPERYQDRYQWRSRNAYKAAIGVGNTYLNLGAELGKYAELKAIVGGVTSIQGMASHKASAWLPSLDDVDQRLNCCRRPGDDEAVSGVVGDDPNPGRRDPREGGRSSPARA